MKESFFTNTLTTLIVRVLSALCTIAISAMIARTFGPHGSGVYSLAVVFIGIAAISALFGMNTATIFYTGKKKYSAKLIIANNIFVSFAAGALIFAVALPLAIIFNDELLKVIDWRITFMAFAAIIPVICFNLLSHILIGMERIKTFNRLSLLQSFLLVAMIFVVSYIFRLDIFAAIAAYALSFFAADIFFAVAAAKYAGGIVWKLNVGYIKDVISYGIKIYPSHLFSFLSSRVNFFIVGFLLNSAAVGFYSVALALAEGLGIFAKSAGTVLIARVVCETDQQKLKEFTPAVNRAVLAMIFLAAIILSLIAYPLITIIYSQNFAAAAPPFIVMLFGVPAFCGWEILSNDIAGRGRQIIISRIAAVAFWGGVVLNIFFILCWGLIGAAWAINAVYFYMFFAASVAYKKISGNGIFEITIIKKSDIKAYWNYLSAALKRVKI
jgi:O-antigen/teichoic acid export membrane protein